MDKIEQLEKRIEELEKQLTAERNKKNKAILSRSLIVNPDYRIEIVKKYSAHNLQDKHRELDLKKAIELAKKESDGAKKLKFWYEYHLKMKKIIGSHYNSAAWYDLNYFVERVIEYHENKIFERLLKEAEFFKGKGNKFDPATPPEKTAKLWDELYPVFSDKKGDVYNEIRKRLNDEKENPENGVLAYPTNKTIRSHLKKTGRI